MKRTSEDRADANDACTDPDLVGVELVRGGQAPGVRISHRGCSVVQWDESHQMSWGRAPCTCSRSGSHQFASGRVLAAFGCRMLAVERRRMRWRGLEEAWFVANLLRRRRNEARRGEARRVRGKNRSHKEDDRTKARWSWLIRSTEVQYCIVN